MQIMKAMKGMGGQITNDEISRHAPDKLGTFTANANLERKNVKHNTGVL